MRKIFAALISPLTPMLYFIVFGLFSAGGSSGWSGILTMASFSIISAYAGLLLLAAPIYLLLERLSILSIPVLVLSGAITGLFFGFLVLKLLSIALGSSIEYISPSGLLLGPLFGATIAFAFALISGVPWLPKS